MAVSSNAVSGTNKAGLAYWMAEVLKEASKASQGFAPDPVHDLRVALRRCRSMAEVVQTFDPEPDWQKMRKAGKRVFSSLGDLRDCQVLIEWVGRLSVEDDPVRQRLLQHLRIEEDRLKALAAKELQSFDGPQWQKWSKTLSKRVAHYRPDSELFIGIALERWEDARDLHRTALRSRSKVALHRLRIGVKKFRYVVENFLPNLHDEISKTLKTVQDVLGEVHDLDVLWSTALGVHVFSTPDDRRKWSEVIQHERQQRVDAYRELAIGTGKVWEQWRSHLPTGDLAEHASLRRIEVWASLLDPEPAHSKRVAGISLRIFDALVREQLLVADAGNTRQLLRAASIMHDVGKDKAEQKHQKHSQKLISAIELPFGWTANDLQVVAVVARYHRGSLPSLEHKAFTALSPQDRNRATALASVLRLANVLDRVLGGSRFVVNRTGDHITITSDVLVNGTREAEKLAAARYLLESVSGVPIVIQGRS